MLTRQVYKPVIVAIRRQFSPERLARRLMGRAVTVTPNHISATRSSSGWKRVGPRDCLRNSNRRIRSLIPESYGLREPNLNL
jgi:hypothetical protein